MIRLFKTPKFENKEYIKKLDNEILLKTKELERVQNSLENPYGQLKVDLEKKEAELLRREKDCLFLEQESMQKIREYELKLSSIENMADELGERNLKLINKEKMLNARELGIKEREEIYLLKKQ